MKVSDMRVTLTPAVVTDAPALAALQNAVADDLTARFGKGHWSGHASQKGVLLQLRQKGVFCVARRRNRIIATLRLCTKKPWAIDISYFTACKKPLYLLNMAVDPAMQRTAIGRLCIQEAARIARQWPADAIRLDCYDAEAGAEEFYRKCGFREVGRTSYRGTPLVYFETIL